MEEAFALVVIVLAGAMFAVFLKLRQANMRLAEATSSSQSFEGRLDDLRKELGAARDEAARKSKALEEARSEAKKKARREGKKMQREDENATDDMQAGGDSREEVTRLRQAIAGLEAQVASLMQDLEQKVAEARAEARQELEGQLRQAREETSAVQRTLDDLRESVRRKAEDRPDLPGTTLDLKVLPTDAVQELARYFRKAEEFERLYGVAQGRLQLAQERAQDLQKRYYAVCRELALLTGGSEAQTDEDLRKAAESVVDKSDQAHASAPAARASAPAAGEAAAPGEEGAKKKKRRRRRRKKKPGEAGMAADGGAEGADEGDDGDDEGSDADEGDEPAATASSESSAPREASAPSEARESSEAPTSSSEPREASATSAEPSEPGEPSEDVQTASEPSSDETRPTSEA